MNALQIGYVGTEGGRVTIHACTPINKSNITLLRVALRKPEISLNCFRRTVFVHFRDYNIECKLNTTLSQVL